MSKKIIYFSDEKNDDFGSTVKKIKPLPADYKYVNDKWYFKVLAFILYKLILKPFAYVYMKIKFSHKFVGKEKLKGLCGHFIFANHTMLVGDAFLPSLLKYGRNNYIITGSAAKSLTAMLPVLKAAGSIPLAENLRQNVEMMKCIKKRLKEGSSVTIYPEAHVWPYYTGIRQFDDVSFKYAVANNSPVVAMTSCYQKRRIFRSPKVVTYIDGPFYPKADLGKAENAEYLHGCVYSAMLSRVSENSTYKYYSYYRA